jgi:hypothetical protein
LSDNTDKPIIVSHIPLWSKIRVIEDNYLPSDYQDSEFFIDIRDIFMQSLSRIYEELNATFIFQPEITLDGVFTKDEYCNDDGKHMNAVYGELVLKTFFQAVSNFK